jgi:hypothetical protein
MKRSTFLLFLTLSLLAALLLTGCRPSEAELAQCLADHGAVMYGQYGCAHCAEQEELFGEGFSKVKYVECTEYPQQCIAAGIKGTPAWKFADNSSLAGVQELTVLAKKAGCRY